MPNGLVYRDRKVLYLPAERRLVTNHGGAPCCCGPGVGGFCCQPSTQTDCDRAERCCTCGLEYVLISNAHIRMVYSFANAPDRLSFDVRIQTRTRYTCDPVTGSRAYVVEGVITEGVVSGTSFNGNTIEGQAVTAFSTREGQGVCPPNIADTLEYAKGAYQDAVDAFVNAYAERYGVASIPFVNAMLPTANQQYTIPLFAQYEGHGTCDRSWSLDGRALGFLGPITDAGNAYVFNYNQDCRTSNYTSSGVCSVALNNTIEHPGTFAWDISASVLIQVVRPCVPDPCTQPPPPPPPPPPGMGACCLQDGTCVVSTAIDCFDQRFGAFLRFNNGEPCESCFGGRPGPVRMRFGDVWRTILGGSR